MATAKKTEVNLSEKIREHLKNAKPSERSPVAVAKALQAKGFDVSPNLVSLQKNRLGMTSKKKNKKKAIKAKARRTTKPSANGHHALLLAKSFLAFAGSIEKAKSLLDVVEKIRS